MPANLSFEAAATAPTVFITADTAFQHAVKLTGQHRVLIHAAAGLYTAFTAIVASLIVNQYAVQQHICVQHLYVL